MDQTVLADGVLRDQLRDRLVRGVVGEECLVRGVGDFSHDAGGRLVLVEVRRLADCGDFEDAAHRARRRVVLEGIEHGGGGAAGARAAGERGQRRDGQPEGGRPAQDRSTSQLAVLPLEHQLVDRAHG